MSTEETPVAGVALKQAVQIGVVVPDLDQATRLLTSLFGIGPFRFVEWPNRPDSRYFFRGKEEHWNWNLSNRWKANATPIANFWTNAAEAFITSFSK